MLSDPCCTAEGAGAPGDATQVLEALLAINGGDSGSGEAGANAAVMIYDPAVATICAGAGVGAELQVRVGGKSGAVAGSPVDMTVTVTAVVKGLTQTHYGAVMSMGDAVALSVVGTDIELVVITVSVL